MNNYVKNSLMPGESIIAEASFSKAFRKLGLYGIIFAILLFIFALRFISSFSLALAGLCEFISPLTIIISVFLLFKGFTLKYNELAITNKKLIGKVGYIKTKEMVSPIQQIQNVSISSGFLGKTFDYGTIKVTTTSGLYNFKYVNESEAIRNAIMMQIENAEQDKMDLHAQKIADAINNTK